jgi:hypothetical protein
LMGKWAFLFAQTLIIRARKIANITKLRLAFTRVQ